jgi:DNA-directed RNA polymerase specialized sigma24 family protein
MAPPRSGNPALVAKIEAILQGPTWPSIYRFLFLVGMRFTKRNDFEAEELVGKALANVYSGAKTGKGRLWNPDKHPDFKAYMGRVVKGVFLDERKRPDQQRHTTIDPADYEQHPNPRTTASGCSPATQSACGARNASRR